MVPWPWQGKGCLQHKLAWVLSPLSGRKRQGEGKRTALLRVKGSDIGAVVLVLHAAVQGLAFRSGDVNGLHTAVGFSQIEFHLYRIHSNTWS